MWLDLSFAFVEVETFFVRNTMLSNGKSRLHVETIKAVLIVRQTYDMKCCKFYSISKSRKTNICSTSFLI